MKKLFLFAASLLLTANLMATVTYYPLTVADIQVTSDNEDDILGDGKVRFDPDKQALTLSNATINGSIWYHPNPYKDDNKLEVQVLGKCVIALDETNTKTAALYVDYAAHLAINGYGTEPAELEIRNMKGGALCSAIALAHYDGKSEVSTSEVSLKVICENGYGIQCDELKVGALSSIDAKAGDDKRGITCADDQIHLTETKIVYSTQNTTTKAKGNHMIIVPWDRVVDYDVAIQGERITNYTAHDIFQNEGGDTWDNVKKVMTLNGEIYNNESDYPLAIFYEPATLEFKNKNNKNFTSTKTPIFRVKKNVTITGSPAIYFNSLWKNAFEIEPTDEDVTLTFDKANIVSFSGGEYSIAKTGSSDKKAHLSFISSHLEMQNVNKISSAKFEGCSITGDGSNPPYELRNGQFVETGDDSACEFGCPVMTNVRIDTNPYSLNILGNPVFPYNASDILGDGGNVSYNHETKTLTVLEDADLIGGITSPVVSVDNQDLTILFKGKPVGFFGEDNQAIKMTNGKKLTLISALGGKNDPIEIASNNNDYLPIIDAVGADVEFRGVLPFKVIVDKGSALDYYVDAPLIKANKLIVNAPLALSNPNIGTTADVLENVPVELNENSELDGLDLEINATTHVVEWKTTSTDKIREVGFIAKKLDEGASITIAGVKVTKLNKGDILGDGKISYDEAAKKLTLNNATIHATTANAIYPDYIPSDKLTIEVMGTNVITCDKMHGITSISCNIDIVGVGTAPYLSIDVEAGGSDFMAYFCYGENLLVKDVTLLATSHHAMGTAVQIGSTPGHLTVDNADLRVAVEESSSTMAAILCGELTMTNGVALRYDEPAWPMITWDEFAKKFDGLDLTHIWIGKSSEFPTDIEDIFVPVEKAQKVLLNGQIFILRGEHIYNMQGMMIR